MDLRLNFHSVDGLNTHAMEFSNLKGLVSRPHIVIIKKKPNFNGEKFVNKLSKLGQWFCRNISLVLL